MTKPTLTSAETQSTEAAATPADLFDNLDALRMSQAFDEEVGVERIVSAVPVRKPRKQEYFRVDAREGFSLDSGILEVQETRETYLVGPNVRDALLGELAFVRLHLCVNRQNAPFIWPVKLEAPDARKNLWRSTAWEAAERAKHRWVRLVPDMSAGHYQLFLAAVDLPEPQWPALDFREILRLSFGSYVINSLDHPAIRVLLGLT